MIFETLSPASADTVEDSFFALIVPCIFVGFIGLLVLLLAGYIFIQLVYLFFSNFSSESGIPVG